MQPTGEDGPCACVQMLIKRCQFFVLRLLGLVLDILVFAKRMHSKITKTAKPDLMPALKQVACGSLVPDARWANGLPILFGLTSSLFSVAWPSICAVAKRAKAIISENYWKMKRSANGRFFVAGFCFDLDDDMVITQSSHGRCHDASPSKFLSELGWCWCS